MTQPPPYAVAIIVAMSDEGIIGSRGSLPWHLPDDLQHFKQLTIGHPVIMGRKTHRDIGRPLPGRTNIVLTRNPDFDTPNILTAHSIDHAIDLAARSPGSNRICIIGGSETYALALPLATELFVTRVHASIQGDTSFPTIDWSHWKLLTTKLHPADDRHAYPFSFQHYTRAL